MKIEYLCSSKCITLKFYSRVRNRYKGTTYKSIEGIRTQQRALAREITRRAQNGNSANAQSRLQRVFNAATRYEANIRKSNPVVFNDPSRIMATAAMYPREVYMGKTASKGNSAG